MKKRIASIILAVVMVVGLLPMTSFAANAVAIDTSNFPDDEFREYVRFFDQNSDGVLSDYERSVVKSIDLFGNNVGSLEGIKYFTELEHLDCAEVELTSIDISKNTKLKELNCAESNLTSLDVTKNPQLTELFCGSNQLTELNVKNNPNLKILLCGNNCLTSLDVTQNTQLTELFCSMNKLSELDVTKNPQLTMLDCETNQLTELNVLNNSQIRFLYCYNNLLTELNITNCPALDDLAADDDVIIRIDEIHPEKSIEINSSNFPDPVFRSYVKENFDRNGDGVLFDVELSVIRFINVKEKEIVSLKGIEFFPKLERLYCAFNNLTDIDVSNNTQLTTLDCSYNKITSLKTQENTLLQSLICENNGLINLDVTANELLMSLLCSENELTELDVSRNVLLRELFCSNNALTELDVSRNKELTSLYCNKNRLSGIDVTRNPFLYSLDCSDNFLPELNLSNNTQLSHLRGEMNPLTCIDISSCPCLSERSITVESSVEIIDNPFCPSEKFADAPNKDDWAHEGIDYCVATGLMNGVSDTAFAPKDTVTRAQLVTILYRVAGSPSVEFKATFEDVPSGLWYTEPIEWAAENGIVNGVAPGVFNPMGYITREQIATILFRYSGDEGPSGRLSRFPDGYTAHPYAEQALAWATEYHYLNGIDVNGVTILAPQSNATREQIAAIIMRYLRCNYCCW